MITNSSLHPLILPRASTVFVSNDPAKDLYTLTHSIIDSLQSSLYYLNTKTGVTEVKGRYVPSKDRQFASWRFMTNCLRERRDFFGAYYQMIGGLAATFHYLSQGKRDWTPDNVLPKLDVELGAFLDVEPFIAVSFSTDPRRPLWVRYRVEKVFGPLIECLKTNKDGLPVTPETLLDLEVQAEQSLRDWVIYAAQLLYTAGCPLSLLTTQLLLC